MIIVAGDPQPLHRARHARNGHTYDDPRNPPNRELIQWAVREQWPRSTLWREAVRVDCEFVMPRPKYHYHKDGTVKQSYEFLEHMKKPDLDNMLKLVKDALTGVVYIDDSQVVSGSQQKRYCECDEKPHTVINLELHTRAENAEAERDRLHTGDFRICINGGCILAAEDTHCDCPDCFGAEGLSPTELLDRMHAMEAERDRLRRFVDTCEDRGIVKACKWCGQPMTEWEEETVCESCFEEAPYECDACHMRFRKLPEDGLCYGGECGTVVARKEVG